MRIYTEAGDLAFKTFNFPDGQPHFQLKTYGREFDRVTLEMGLPTSIALLTLELAVDVLRSNGYTDIRLDIRYLMGARMDRPIGWGEPFTLAVIARRINALGLSRVRILDVHSEVAERLIRNSVNVLPRNVVRSVIATSLWAEIAAFIIPDKGAKARVAELTKEWGGHRIQAGKIRDEATGELSGFYVEDHDRIRGAKCLIIDDICDGGGTFIGLAAELRKAGARSVDLYVTHGIFSRGVGVLRTGGIDHIYTTNSYKEWPGNIPSFTITPVSMKDII
jgi:ribose-phosphate pyrophosphokinase